MIENKSFFLTTGFAFIACLAVTLPGPGALASPRNQAPKRTVDTAGKIDSAAPTSPGERQSESLNEEGVAAVKAKEFGKAQKLFESALTANRYNVTAVFNLASVYLTLHQEPQAIELLKRYTEEHPADPGLFARLGDAYFASKKIKDAASAYEKAMSLAPDYIGIPAKLGSIYALQNRLQDAERMLAKATSQDPNNPYWAANYSGILLANGKTPESIAAAKRAIQLHPTADAYVTLGTAHEIMKDPKKALIAFQRSADLGNKDPKLAEKIAELKKVAGATAH